MLLTYTAVCKAADAPGSCKEINAIAFTTTPHETSILSSYGVTNRRAWALLNRLPAYNRAEPQVQRSCSIQSDQFINGFRQLACTSNGQYIAAIGAYASGMHDANRCVELWRFRSNRYGDVSYEPYRQLLTSGYICSISFTADSTVLIITHTCDNSMQVYSIASGAEIQQCKQLGATGESMCTAAVTADDSYMITASNWLPVVHVWSHRKMKNSDDLYALLKNGLHMPVEKRQFKVLQNLLQQCPAAALEPYFDSKSSTVSNLLLYCLEHYTEVVEYILDPELSFIQGKFVKCRSNAFRYTTHHFFDLSVVMSKFCISVYCASIELTKVT
jgi:WD40 repeat protein